MQSSIYRKIRKLLTNPISYFKDSWIFKAIRLKDIKQVENLFVISHLGQLRQVQQLIKEKKLKKNGLTILFTQRSLDMHSLIIDNIEQKLFNKITSVKLPFPPNKIYIKTLSIINNTYERLLNDTKPKVLFLLSFEKHYNLLSARAKERKIRLCLIEEGTATYKYANAKEGDILIRTNLSQSEKISSFLIKYCHFLKDLRPALSYNKSFDCAYVTYPELLKDTFRIKKFFYFFPYRPNQCSDTIKAIAKKYKATSEDYLFLSQRYRFQNENYCNALIDLLSKISISVKKRIFIKFHPKEDGEVIKKIIENLNSLNLESNIIVISENDFLVEELLALVPPKYLLGLTSTALAFSPRVTGLKTKSISIYPLLRASMIESDQSLEDKFTEADNHFKILQKFPVVDIPISFNDLIKSIT